MRVIIKSIAIIFFCLVSSLASARPVVKMFLNGVPEPISQNVTTRLDKLASNYLSAPTPNAMDYLIQAAPDAVFKAIAPYGYLSAKVDQVVKHNGNNWVLTYNVKLGPATIIRKVNIKIRGAGANTAPFQKVLNKDAPKVGSILNIRKYNNFFNRLTTKANSYGYFNAQVVRKKILVSRRNNTAHIVIIYDTGPRSKFGVTYFSKVPLNINFLKRYLTYCAGQPYSEKKVQRLQQDLTNSNYFNRVIVTPKIGQIDRDQVPIDVSLASAKSRKYSIGVGYGTDTGPRTTLGVTFRRLNSYGHKLSIATQLSKIAQNATVEYIIPGIQPAKNYYTISAGYSKQNLSIGDSNAKKVAVSYNTVWRQLEQTISIGYLNERYNLNNTPKVNANMLVPSITWMRRRANHAVVPSKGYMVSLRLSGAYKGILSNTSFYQVYLTGRFLHSFFHKNQRLIAKMEMGYTDINNLTNLPLSLQLLAGGSSSVRGYSYNSIGPGNFLRVTSVELQQRIYKELYLGGFYDAAMVSDNFTKGTLYQSAGPALAWWSPIGTIEVSAARRLGIDTNRNIWGFNFNIGTVI